MKTRLRPPRGRTSPSPAPAAPPWSDVLVAFNDAVIVMDHDRRIVLFNPAAEELTGLPQRRALGTPCEAVFAETPWLSEMVRRVQELGQSEARSEEPLRRGRRGIPVRVTCLPLWNQRDDSVSGTALVIHDLGYQKTLEEAVRRNESLARLGTMVAGLAHEVRNPLAGIKGAAQLLATRLGDRPELAEYTGVITREANRLAALVEDLLILGTPPKPHLAPFNVHRLIQHVVALMEPDLARAGVKVQYEFDPSLPDVLGDEAQLSQVLLNVLRNAVDAMAGAAAGGRGGDAIAISTRMETDFHILHGRDDRARKFLRVEVADQGPGIDPAAAAHVFEPFFTTKPRGTGLGLAISQTIVAEHGGSIRAGANQPRGTVVTITLPVAAR